MSANQSRVVFQPQGRQVFVLSGSTVLEAAARAGLVIDTPCGGAGTCGKCRVQLVNDAPPAVASERRAFAAEALAAGWRLACQCRVEQDLVIHTPASSLFGGTPQIVDGSTVGGPGEVRPAIRKVYVELAPPTLADETADLLRLEGATGPFRIELSMLRQVPRRLRACGFKGTAVLADQQLLDFEAGDTRGRCFGVAFDIGTTTIAAALVNLSTGEDAGTHCRMNPQVSFGDDVLSRIRHSGSGPECLEELRRAVIDEVGRMIEALCATAGVAPREIYEAAFAGNTTMQHLLCGIDPAQLGEAPFAPAYARGLLLAARELEVPINPRGTAYVFPLIGGFVGGDTVAGMLVTGMADSAGPTLLVDIGTNGEIVLAHEGRLLAASTAAGPAFEGARISGGRRGTTGAIEKVVFAGDVRVEVIGNVAPSGICGSGLIDLMAELLRHGVVSPEGQLRAPADLPASLSEPVARRVRRGPDGRWEFVLVAAGGRQDAVCFTQRDIRELQLGCGAIRAGIVALLNVAGLRPEALATVLIAGGFGSFISRRQAQRIGLLPPEVPHERIHYVGNTSLAGARWALLSVAARQRAEVLARQARHVELSMIKDFQAAFVDAMVFPEA